MAATECVVTINVLCIVKDVKGAELIGWQEDKLVGRPLLNIIPESYKEGFLLAIAYYILTGELAILNQTIPVHVVTEHGQEVPMLLLTKEDGHGDYLNILTPRDTIEEQAAQEHTILSNALAKLNALRDSIAALHADVEGETCSECLKPWPCPTMELLEE